MFLALLSDHHGHFLPYHHQELVSNVHLLRASGKSVLPHSCAFSPAPIPSPPCLSIPLFAHSTPLLCVCCIAGQRISSRSACENSLASMAKSRRSSICQLVALHMLGSWMKSLLQARSSTGMKPLSTHQRSRFARICNVHFILSPLLVNCCCCRWYHGVSFQH